MAKPDDSVIAVAGPGWRGRTGTHKSVLLKGLDDCFESLADDEHLVAHPVLDERILGVKVGGQSHTVDDERLAPVACPRSNRCPQRADLGFPSLIVIADPIGSYYEDVDVALSVAVPTCGTAEERNVERSDWPRCHGLADPPEQSRADPGEFLDGRPRQVLTIGGVESHAWVLFGADKSVGHHPSQNELHTRETAALGEPVDFPSRQSSGRAGKDLEHRGIECRDGTADRMGDVHVDEHYTVQVISQVAI